MRVALVGEGTYPVAPGGVSTWADLLIRELAEVEFEVVTIVGQAPQPGWTVAPNVSGVTLVPIWDPPPERIGIRSLLARHSLDRLRGLLGEIWELALQRDPDLDAFEEALKQLTGPWPRPLRWFLQQAGSTEAILRSWTIQRHQRGGLPPLSGGEAAIIARFVDRSLALLDRPYPQADLIHTTANGNAMLVALAQQWNSGAPILLTEHGVYLRERYLALDDSDFTWPVRHILMQFSRVLCQLGYRRAQRQAPVSEFNARWALELGACPAAVQVIPNGVVADRFPPITTDPERPTIAFVGRINPLKDLETMIRAVGLVRERIPEVKLRLFGPTSDEDQEYRSRLESLIVELDLTDVVSFEGPCASPVTAFRSGQVVALSSKSEGLPFTVIEAMMCGRATVNTDVGGVAECTGRDGAAGLVVPPMDSEAFADALTALLLDDDRRREMGARARARALERFTSAQFADAYRSVYRDLHGETWLAEDARSGAQVAGSFAEARP
ncbi:MAG: GT4 family glycosyltransferase PelF [Propioniciclava sp.]